MATAGLQSGLVLLSPELNSGCHPVSVPGTWTVALLSRIIGAVAYCLSAPQWSRVSPVPPTSRCHALRSHFGNIVTFNGSVYTRRFAVLRGPILLLYNSVKESEPSDVLLLDGAWGASLRPCQVLCCGCCWIR